MPTVSIVTPVYNTAKYLRECLDSILIQSYQDFELICVNDGSTDNCASILNEYADKDVRVKLYSLDSNTGPANARNVALSHASGDYIVFVDSDDSIEQDYLHKILEMYKNGNYDCIAIGSQFWHLVFGLQYVLPTWGMSVSRRVLDKYPNVRFSDIRPCEDGIFSHKILSLVDRVGICGDAIYNYRIREGSSERTLMPNYMFDQIPKWFDILEHFYNEYDLWNTGAHRLMTFVAVEPFGRFSCHINFNEEQRRDLFDLMHAFIDRHNLLGKWYPELIGNDFTNFCHAKSYEEYKKATAVKASKASRYLRIFKAVLNTPSLASTIVYNVLHYFSLRHLSKRFRIK